MYSVTHLYKFVDISNFHKRNAKCSNINSSIYRLRKEARDDDSRCFLMRSRENHLRRENEKSVNAGDMSHLYLDIHMRADRDKTRRDETRDERRDESYSAALTAQPRRESCQFRSDPRVRVPETAGLALVSTHPSAGLSLDYSRGASLNEFSRLYFFFFPRTRHVRTVLSVYQSGVTEPFTVLTRVSNFRYPRRTCLILCRPMMAAASSITDTRDNECNSLKIDPGANICLVNTTTAL